MITNNFKSKAKNMAFKSYLYEMKKRGYFWESLTSIMEFIIRNTRIPGYERNDLRHRKCNTSLYTFRSIDSTISNPIKDVLNHITQHIEKHFAENRTQKSEYDYLVHCVNTMLMLFVEPFITKLEHFSSDRMKMQFMENLGREIFTRAAKKTFGDDFTIQTPPQQPVPESMSELARKITFENADKDQIEELSTKLLENESLRELLMRLGVLDNPF